MHEDKLAAFGQLVALRLRDPAVEGFENFCKGNIKAPALLDLQKEVQALSPEVQSIVHRCLISAIDGAIHDFLFSLQEGECGTHSIEVAVGGESVSELSDGLHGEIFGDEGWFAKFSAYGQPPEKA